MRVHKTRPSVPSSGALRAPDPPRGKQKSTASSGGRPGRNLWNKNFLVSCTFPCNFSLHSRRECRDFSGAGIWSFASAPAEAPAPGGDRGERPRSGGILNKRGDFLNQTNNYQLCQWDPEDFIFRTDFNADNAKIDAALQTQADALKAEEDARTAADMRVRLLNVPTGAPVRAVTLDVQDIDFSPYLWAELVVDIPKNACELYLQPDGAGTFRACQLGGEVYDSYAAAFGIPDGSGMGGMRVKMWSYPGSDRTHFLSARMGEEEFTVLHTIHLKPINEIKKLNIWASEETGMPIDTYIRIYGVKR